MSLLATAAVKASNVVSLVLPTVAEEFTVDDFAAAALAGAGTVLIWIGAATAAGATVFFAVIGIKKGFAWLKTMIKSA